MFRYRTFSLIFSILLPLLAFGQHQQFQYLRVDPEKPDTMRSDTMRSDTMQSDVMRSNAMRPESMLTERLSTEAQIYGQKMRSLMLTHTTELIGYNHPINLRMKSR